MERLAGLLLPNTVLDLVSRWRAGDSSALTELYGLCGRKLHRIAAGHLRREREGHTWQPTALVNELIVKWCRSLPPVNSEAHFYNMAAYSMRLLLIDHARKRQSEQQATLRGVLDQLGEAISGKSASERNVEIRHAYERFQRLDPAAGRTLWLRAVEGHTIAQTALLMGAKPAKVRENYDYAVRWMTNHLS